MCSKLGADYLQLNSSLNATDSQNAEQKHSALFLIRAKVESDDFQEVRVSVLGNVDAGKSTLLSVLTHGQLDDGRGLARQKLFRHKHEIESGRTSSVGSDILGKWLLKICRQNFVMLTESMLDRYFQLL